MVLKRSLWALLCLLLLPALSFAQQTGAVSGKVVGSDGLVLPGRDRRGAVRGAAGAARDRERRSGRLPAAGAAAGPLHADVRAVGHGARSPRRSWSSSHQDTVVDVTMSVAGVTRDGQRVGRRSSRSSRRTRPRSRAACRPRRFRSLPVGQEYRDLIKLIPGVQYTQDAMRGPSAGGSGQDNVYKFDGVNVTLPLFGTLSTEPASYDIAQVTTIKGGAKAVDFERAGGFTVDSVSKSGHATRSPGRSATSSRTPRWRPTLDERQPLEVRPEPRLAHGQRRRPADPEQGCSSTGRTTGRRVAATNAANVYGDLPDYKSMRNEGFVQGDDHADQLRSCST